jgi:hypothetical protein
MDRRVSRLQRLLFCRLPSNAMSGTNSRAIDWRIRMLYNRVMHKQTTNLIIGRRDWRIWVLFTRAYSPVSFVIN